MLKRIERTGTLSPDPGNSVVSSTQLRRCSLASIQLLLNTASTQSRQRDDSLAATVSSRNIRVVQDR
ncbi:unnamed protein product [Gongylonema pulchrum]|uniref:Uncharacterized protein n=1 Tax=Gongylonema pulchrum TaxID=637853 RepID=A0A183ERW0_9BILA|nr:unnamed protein product [Gongylonema pulchrum]